MRLRFEDPFTDDRLAYQRHAIEAVCDLFAGQEDLRSDWGGGSDVAPSQDVLPLTAVALRRGNALRLAHEDLVRNLTAVQARNGLTPDGVLPKDGYNFAVEMETGTGKTYVYLRTAYEMNRRYGFTKFIIVVPSVAIREGVAKTLETTQEHFRALYGGDDVTAGPSFFVYDPNRMGRVRDFADSGRLQIMVITIGSMRNVDKNVLFGKGANEGTGGVPPIELIQKVCPVVIVDEPQSVDGGLEGAGRKALGLLNPLCTLRYSATHAVKDPLVYRLNAVDAYEQKLVKGIEVASARVLDMHNAAYVRLLEVRAKRSTVEARVELDVDTGGGKVRRKEVWVNDGEMLSITTDRPEYEGFFVGTIMAKKGERYMELRYPGGSTILMEGRAYGGVDEETIERLMVKRTIKEHLDRENILGPKGIKVLSLFFVAQVKDYREYDKDGVPKPGRLARVFEEEYTALLNLPTYRTLFDEVDRRFPGREVHEALELAAKDDRDAYFAEDRNRRATDPALNEDGEAKNKQGREEAERGFDLIMRNKEALLSLNNPVKFIFSHSALKEGWDNPNVFQICNFSERGTDRWRRQTIGRGLRLCVDANGERVRDPAVNLLTVVANESYEEFAEKLQRDIEADTEVRFGVVEADAFFFVSFTDEEGRVTRLDREGSETLWRALQTQGMLDAKGKVNDELRRALRDGTLPLTAELEPVRAQIEAILRRAAGRVEIKDRDDRQAIPLNKAVYLSEEFRELWDRIKGRTRYRVRFDSKVFLDQCVSAFREAGPIGRPRIQFLKTGVAVTQAGVEGTTLQTDAPTLLYEPGLPWPDVLSRLEGLTRLTRRSIAYIIAESKRHRDFENNRKVLSSGLSRWWGGARRRPWWTASSTSGLETRVTP